MRQFAQALASAPPGEATDDLPAWDLSALYPAPDSPAVEADFTAADSAARAFSAAHAGKLASMDGAGLAAAIGDFERIEETLGRLMSYAQLLFSGDSTDPVIGRFYQTVSERITAISSQLIFFSLELNRLDDAVLEKKLADPALARWRPWLNDLRVFRPHQLDDALEKLFHEKDVSGRAAWSRLFDETIAGMRIKLGEDELTVSGVLNKLSDADRAVREAAGHAIGSAFGDRQRLFALITNTLAKDKEISDTWRHYARPTSSRNRANMVEDEVVGRA
jgi:oligoendopeptidase F